MKKLAWILLAAVTLLFWPVVYYVYQYFNPYEKKYINAQKLSDRQKGKRK